MGPGCPRAWAGAPRGGIPNDSIEIARGRRASSVDAEAVQGETGQAGRRSFHSRGHWMVHRDADLESPISGLVSPT